MIFQNITFVLLFLDKIRASLVSTSSIIIETILPTLYKLFNEINCFI